MKNKEHQYLLNKKGRKKQLNKQAGKSANIVELNSKLSKQTCLFIRYLRVLLSI